MTLRRERRPWMLQRLLIRRLPISRQANLRRRFPGGGHRLRGTQGFLPQGPRQHQLVTR